ncbi:sh3px3 protein [Moniliophthora roreri]|nr:sh3px3 protein [Moniliophthora roreri]
MKNCRTESTLNGRNISADHAEHMFRDALPAGRRHVINQATYMNQAQIVEINGRAIGRLHPR